MRFTRTLLPSVVVAVVATASVSAWANYALTLNSHATISSLSAQLLAKPRSAAGDKKNVWDCDPAEPAVTGLNYFLYNLDANNNPLTASNRVITLTGVQFGPGYSGQVDVLVRPTQGPGAGIPTFIEPDSNGVVNLNGAIELGLARVTFTQNGDPTGQIQESDDIELGYAASDVNGQPTNTRGVEHVRFATQYLAHDAVSDARVARGEMTAVVPSSFATLAPPGQTFDAGFLSFAGDNVSMGSNVYSAIVQTNPLAQTWISPSNGFWDTTTRWQDGNIATGANVVGRFTALDLNGVITVTNGQSRAIGGMTFADTDTTTAGGYQIVGSALTLSGTTPTITLGSLASSSRAQIDTVLANVIGNLSSLTIVGTNSTKAVVGGALVLTANNTYGGGTTLQNATLYVGAPVTTPSTASIGAPGSNVTLTGFNVIANGTSDGSFKFTLNHNFIANAGSVTTFMLMHSGDIGIPSASAADHRSVTGTGTVVLNADSNSNNARVFADFTNFAGRLTLNGTGPIQFFTGTSGATPGFVGTGFGAAAVTCDGSVSVGFHNDAGGGVVNFGSLSGTSATAGFYGGSAGATNMVIGSLNTSTTFAGTINGNSQLTKVGTGSLALSGHNLYTGATTISGGSLVLGSLAQEPVLGGPSITSPAGADIKGGKLVLQYAAGSSPAAAVQSILKIGYGQSTKFSTGLLRSSGLPADRLLGWRDVTGSGQVEVAFTLPGDADLNFGVDFNDLLALAQHYNAASGATWSQADFTYDGAVNFNDLLALARSYNQTLSDGETAQLGSAVATDYLLAQSLVPEPGTAALIGLGVLAIGRRRRI